MQGEEDFVAAAVFLETRCVADVLGLDRCTDSGAGELRALRLLPKRTARGQDGGDEFALGHHSTVCPQEYRRWPRAVRRGAADFAQRSRARGDDLPDALASDIADLHKIALAWPGERVDGRRDFQPRNG